VLQRHGDVRRHRFPGKSLEGIGVSVDTEEHAPWSNPFDQSARMAATPEGGIDERLPGDWLKARYDFL
jgi:hypothetical protein